MTEQPGIPNSPTGVPAPPPTQTEIPKDASEIPDDPNAPLVKPGAFLLELIPVPVTDIDRAKRFYSEQAGFHVDVDVSPADGVRVVQLTPPGSFCSITLLQGLPMMDMEPGSLRGLHLVVKDIEAARQELIGRGVEVGETEDLGGVFYAWFQDPDGNTWTLQHMPWRP
ncbi:VOC family protein [Kribbella sp. NPDC050281]|uniref:VOC family protein n=1 Tax=Kribbella sp. NPDC050281 TaxID=3155515 RepID=UPI0034080A6D